MVIWPGVNWLIWKLTEPSSVRDKLPPTKLVVTLDGTNRSSSDCKTGRTRLDGRAGDAMRRPPRLTNLFIKLRTDICNLQVKEATTEPGQNRRGTEAPPASPHRKLNRVFLSAVGDRA